MFDKSVKYITCILLPIGVLFALFAKEIITTIFGSEYIQSVTPFLILLIARVFKDTTITPMGSSFAGIGRPDIGLKVDSLSLVLNVLLCWLLIPRFGILGASMATTISLLVGNIVYVKLLPLLTVKLDYKWYGLAFGLAGVALAVNWIGVQFINHYIVSSIIFIAYATLVLTVLATREDRDFFRSLFLSFLKLKRQ